jgi:hypothetical protein
VRSDDDTSGWIVEDHPVNARWDNRGVGSNEEARIRIQKHADRPLAMGLKARNFSGETCWRGT